MTQLMGGRYTPSNEASQLAKKYDLGRPVYEFKESVSKYGCGAAFCFVVGIFCLVAGAAGNSSSGGGAVIMLMIGGGALLIGIFALFSSVATSSNRLFAYMDGFVYRRGNDEKVVLWKDVKAIYQRIIEHRSRVGKYKEYNYAIEKFDGSRLTFSDNMVPMEGLCNYIETSMINRLLPTVTRTYELGQIVEFGPLAVSKQGIFNGKEWLAWENINGIRVENGFISVKKMGKWLHWANFYTPSIPNFTVLELLIQYIGRPRDW